MTEPTTGRHAPAGQSVDALKRALRDTIRARRTALTPADWVALDAARTAAALALLDRRGTPDCVALYCSRAGEPGTGVLIDELLRRGTRLLVPVLSHAGPDGPVPMTDPDWAELDSSDQLRPGRFGVPEPDAPALGTAALGSADLVICSALACTPTGLRLGMGGGWYDRALVHRRPEAPLWALVNHDEVLQDLPHDNHDQRVDLVVSDRGVESTQR